MHTKASDGSTPISTAYSNQCRKLVKLLESHESQIEEQASEPTIKKPVGASSSEHERPASSPPKAKKAKRKRRTTPMGERARRAGVSDKLKPLAGLSGKDLQRAQIANQQIVAVAEKHQRSSTAQYGAPPERKGPSDSESSDEEELYICPSDYDEWSCFPGPNKVVYVKGGRSLR